MVFDPCAKQRHSRFRVSVVYLHMATKAPDDPILKRFCAAVSDNPFSTFAESEGLERALGAELIDTGFSGHINVESGHGPWPEGLMRFAGFMKTL